MKLTLYYFILSISLLLGSCSPELDYVNSTEVNPENFPQTADDVETIVASSYFPLRGEYLTGIHNTSERGLMFILDATTEILQGPFGIQQEATLHSYNVNTTGVTLFYDEYYNQISGMTTDIDQIENSDVVEEAKRKGIAEIRCARALLSYELFDMYGPLVVAPLEVLQNPLGELPLPRLSEAEMVSFIEQDLLAAIPDLPLPQDAIYGRFSQGMARMILIRLYLHQKRWSDVQTQADLIMEYGHYELEEDYVGLWDTEAPTDSNEIIWAVPANYAGTSQNQWQLMVLPANYPNRGGFGTIQSSWTFYDSFEDSDIRKTNLITEYEGTDGVTYNRDNPGTIMQLGPLPLKIAEDADRETGVTTVDIIVYRYPDVLLSKAEAIANASGTPNQEAIDLVNVVRRRAQISEVSLADYSDLNSFNDLILLERSHEYWCENGQYRADLIRHGKYVERANELNGAASQSAPFKTLFPFSLARISEGKGLFKQNPGYN